MTGLDCLRDELIKRGFSKSQVNSKVVPAVLDILAGSGTKYEDMWKDESDASTRLEDLKVEIRNKERRAARLDSQAETARRHLEHYAGYIDEFNKGLTECETSEGRDAMRAAQIYINSVDVDTAYDNTAYIIGLASILSRGEIGAINELRKINKKFPAWEVV